MAMTRTIRTTLFQEELRKAAHAVEPAPDHLSPAERRAHAVLVQCRLALMAYGKRETNKGNSDLLHAIVHRATVVLVDLEEDPPTCEGEERTPGP